ncbi:MAG: hypothetical protein EAZ91_02320 [Cytophagales bacterium]|nr:MAG: hypothetical protein EAZ91_02320 [Cytophagales bacterium]
MAHELIISPPSNSQRESFLEIDFVRRQVRLAVTGFTFLDHEHTIIYLPSLNLSAYGNSQEEAKTMLSEVVLDDFCENLIALSPVEAREFLGDLGWAMDAGNGLNFSNSAFVDKDGILRNFDLPQDTPISEQVVSF